MNTTAATTLDHPAWRAADLLVDETDLATHSTRPVYVQGIDYGSIGVVLLRNDGEPPRVALTHGPLRLDAGEYTPDQADALADMLREHAAAARSNSGLAVAR